MRNNKKAQITMFVILGLVLLIIFILFISMKKENETKIFSVKRILSELETGSIKNHITSCIEQTAMNGLEKLGANGGVIYDFERGTIPFNNMNLGEGYLNFTSLSRNYSVAYALKENPCNAISYRVPDYPYPDGIFSMIIPNYNLNCLYQYPFASFDGSFGQNTMSKLCYIARESGCERFAKGIELGLTMQRQLEDYVKKNLDSCIDFTGFSDRMNVDITTESEPVVEADIYKSEIFLLIRYPVEITFENQEPVTRIINYQTTLKVRLGLIYNFLYDVLSLDSQEVDFDIKNNYIKSQFYTSDFRLEKKDSNCDSCPLPYRYDDILEITDWKSKVNGKPFLFRVSIRNRKPALDFIPDIDIDLNKTAPPVQIDIPIKAYDPDDADAGLKYYFLSLGYGKDKCQGYGTQNPITDYNTTGTSGCSCNWIDLGCGGSCASDEMYKTPVSCTPTGCDSAKCVPDPACGASGGSTGWCENDPYISGAKGSLSGPNLRMLVNKYDSGDHKIGVLVVDDSGLFDYQFFKINITDSKDIQDLDPACVVACNTHGDIGDCNKWCKISANPCRSECFGGKFISDPASGGCWDCVYPIYSSPSPQTHVDCSQLSDSTACNNNMPNCFWVKENKTGGFVDESCYNDTSLNTVLYPAYILIN